MLHIEVWTRLEGGGTYRKYRDTPDQHLNSTFGELGCSFSQQRWNAVFHFLKLFVGCCCGLSYFDCALLPSPISVIIEEHNTAYKPTSMNNQKYLSDSNKRLEVRSLDLLPPDFEPGEWDVICQRGKECFQHGKQQEIARTASW